MKVAITHLKAPWPAGAVVGSVVLLEAPGVPAWAAGKCTPLAADDEREAEFLWQPPARPAAPELVVNPASEADRKAAELGALLDKQTQQLADLRAQLQDAQQALGTARAEIGSLVAERDAALADLQALRQSLPPAGTGIGDGTGVAAPAVEEAKAPATAKASKKGAAA